MNFKITGIIFVLTAGIYSVYVIKKNYDKRINSLTEFIKNLDFIYTHISFYKTPISDIIKLLYDNSEGIIKSFYEKTLNEMEHKNANMAFISAVSDTDTGLNKKDRVVLYEFAKMLGNTDYDNQINNIKATKQFLRTNLEEAKEFKNKNQKSKCALTMCGFIAVILIFI